MIDTRSVDHVFHTDVPPERQANPTFGHRMDWSGRCTICAEAEPKLVVVDLFAGEGNWSQPARDRGHTTWTSDFDPVYGTDHVGDARELTGAEILAAVGPVDLLLMSPPCQGFTVLRIGKNWTRPSGGAMVSRYPHLGSDTRPKTEKAEMSMELVQAALRIRDELQPRWWLMENPVGKLRKLPMVGALPHRQVTYCSYGRYFRKPTDLWGEAPPSMVFRPPCDAYNSPVRKTIDGTEWCCSPRTGEPCHVAGPRGSQTGVQGNKRLVSTAIPYPLAWDVTVAAESDVAAGRSGTSGQEAMLL